MIKYIGSKRLLIPHIVRAVEAFPGVAAILDLFAGTSRVGHALKARGYHIHANDHLSYAATLARCYIEADSHTYAGTAQALIADLQQTPPVDGYFTEVFCRQARFFQPHNGMRIDGIREKIEELALTPPLKAIVLTSLMEAADRVDSTTGVQMAYLKKWAPRSYNNLELRLPQLLPGGGRATQLDALAAAAGADVDLAYLDPPYNQHSYIGNYHIWETLVRWDKPEHYGVACKRIGCREYRSSFNRKREIAGAMDQVVQAVQARYLLVSFSNEGYLAQPEMEAILQRRGAVHTIVIAHKRYVGAQIGIHNPAGERVGKISHLRNREFLYLVAEDRAVVERVGAAIQAGLADRQLELAIRG